MIKTIVLTMAMALVSTTASATSDKDKCMAWAEVVDEFYVACIGTEA